MKITLIAMVSLTVMIAAAWGQELPGSDDATGQAEVQQLHWEPMIVEFFADSTHGGAAVVAPPSKVPPSAANVYGEAAQWLALKPRIAPRTAAYAANESVLCAWQRKANDQGQVEFVTYGSGSYGEQQPTPQTGKLHAIFAKDSEVRLFFDLDVLANRTPDEKDKLLRNYFKLAELLVTAVKISDDPTKFRDAAPPNAPAYPILRVYSERELIGEDFVPTMGRWTRPSGSIKWDVRQSRSEVGVFEFRIKARLLGRANGDEQYASKSIEGAIRIAMVNDTRLAISKLNYDTMRKPGERDLIKDGLLGGTVQDKPPAQR